MHLRSVELQVPDRAAAVEFLAGPWGLGVVESNDDTTYVGGTAPLHYAIAVTGGASRALLSATFIGTPFGACVEYTAEVQRVDDSYTTGTPEFWKWPPGRTDHWGIASRDNEKLAASGETFPYRLIAA